MRRLFKTRVKVTDPQGNIRYDNHRTRVHPGECPKQEACRTSAFTRHYMDANLWKYECVECTELSPITGDPI